MNRSHPTTSPADRRIIGPRRAAGGFTLIELLVVIGIIALLIAILIPVLGSARESARQSVCASNQRQLAIATQSFAIDHQGRLPSHYDPNGPFAPDTIGSPVLTYRITAGPSANSVEPVGMGRLMDQGFVSSPDAYYCPSQDAAFWQKSFFPAPFGEVGKPGLSGTDSNADASAYIVRGNYMYNPVVRFGSNSFGPKPRLYQTVQAFDTEIGPDGQNQFPTQAPLFMDLLIGWGYQTNAHDNQSVFQVTFIDGHVEARKDPFITRVYRDEIAAFKTINHETFKAFLLAELLLDD